MRIDPEFKALIAPLRPDELAGLEASIKADGCRDPLVVWGDVVVDGHNRLEICDRLGLPYKVQVMSFVDRLDAMVWIRRNQLGRRNLTDDQRAVQAEALGELLSEVAIRDRNKRNPSKNVVADVATTFLEQKPKTREVVAKDAGVSQHKIRQVKEVKKANPALIAKIASGEVKLADAVRETKKAEIIAKLESIDVKQAKAIQGVYDVVVIDPPWAMEKIERDVAPNQVGFDYPTMSEEEIGNLSIPCSDDCHVWLWTTHKFLPQALRLLDRWGLKYVCTFVWRKPGGFQPIGLPQYNCEFALYARNGTPKFVDTKAFNVCFQAARGAHSEKPGEFYDVVRRVTAGRRLDMFNRRQIEGFDGWGKESK